MQYCERAVFEDHLSNPAPFKILPQRLARLAYSARDELLPIFIKS